MLLLLLCGCASPDAWIPVSLAADESAPCNTCGTITDADQGGGRWPDERVACERCIDRAVTDGEGAAAMFAEAKSELHDLLGLQDLEAARARLRLTDTARLQALAGDVAHPDLRAFTEVLEVIRGDTVESRRFTIHVLKGMPRACLLGILCHELFHVWQTMRGGVRREADPAFREGAAQFVQYRVLQLRGEDMWTERLLANPDPVYGGGLRRFLQLVADKGSDAALELGATTDGFPPGY